MTAFRGRPADGFATCVLVLLMALAAGPAGARHGGWEGPPDGREDRDGSEDREGVGRRDPLVGMLRRIDRFMQRNESDGVVMDARYVVNATEAARLSVVSQLLAYTELYKVVPTRRVRRDITDRGDFLIRRFDDVRSGTVFDGMLGYAFLEAYVETHEPRYLEYGRAIAEELKALPRSERILNGGLMGAMALVEYYRLTGDEESLRFVDDCMGSLPAYQHVNGSFPHWCVCSTDIHYTDWMTTELILIQRQLDRPDIDPMLGRMRTFLEGRIDEHGVTHYVDSCTAYPGCVIPYYSIASGCGIDYDTRAWTNELGYSALLFDHFGSPTYGRVMRFMRSLEHGGTFPDKWDFWGPTSDPYYVWTAADTSVINTSLIFWSLASVLSGRRGRVSCRQWPEDETSDPAVTGKTRAAGAMRAIGDPAQVAGRRTAVDSLLVAGESPTRYCDAVAGAPGLEPGREPAPGASSASSMSQQAAGEPDHRPLALRLEIAAGTLTESGCAIRFSLAERGPVRLAIYDAGGRRVRELLAGALEVGEHRSVWDRRDDSGRPCPSGIYFVSLRAVSGIRVARTSVIH